MEKTWGRAVAAGNAPFKFAPAEGTQFFESHGWVEAEFRSMWVEANRLKRAEIPVRLAMAAARAAQPESGVRKSFAAWRGWCCCDVAKG
jgi:hypothetical protein